MEVGETVYPQHRQDWHEWLAKHHRTKTEIWVQKYRKATGKPSIPYDDLVECCLCFGWIDGIIKKHGPEGSAQRITPRRKKSFLSELNRQRIWKLQKIGEMTPAGVAPIANQIGSPDDPILIPAWFEDALRQEGQWDAFRDFPHFYQRLKVGWISEVGNTSRAQLERQKRLAHLIAMTKKGKRYGTEPLLDWDSP
ncbi:MAG: hypothetical protein AAF191_11735 [Verrucomicrobiota bacterium]